MDRVPGGQSVVRTEFLCVPPALQSIRRRSLTPVTLERGWVVMETPGHTASSSVDPASSPTTTSTSTSSTATSTTTTSSSSKSTPTSTATTKPAGTEGTARIHYSPSLPSRLPRSHANDTPRAVPPSLSVPGVSPNQVTAQTSSSTHQGEAAASAVTSAPSSGSQKLGATSPLLGRRMGDTSPLQGRRLRDPRETSGIPTPKSSPSASVLSSGSQKLGATSPQPRRRMGDTSPLLARRLKDPRDPRDTPSSSLSKSPSSAEAASPASYKVLGKTDGQQPTHPTGAEGPPTIQPKTAPGDVEDGGVRTPAAPQGNQPDAVTRNQAHLEETTLLQAGHKPDETKTLSTGDNQASSRLPARGATDGDRGNHSGRHRGRESAKKAGGTSSLAVQFSESSSSPRPSPRDVGDVMQFFAEQEKSLQDSFLSLPKKSVKKQRSPSPKVSPSAGLEHLDNLVRLMEQLGSLKDENSRLRQRCHYLESTKVLLQARKDLAAFEAGGTPARYKTMPTKQQKQRHLYHRHHHHHQHQKKGDEDPGSHDTSLLDVSGRVNGGRVSPSSRPRLSSAEELDYIELVDSSSDQRPKRSKSGMPKRSFSTGSLEVPSELLLGEVSEGETRKRLKSKTGRSIFSSKSGAKSKSSKSGSKWARVKKVLTGQKIYEDLGTTIRTIRDLGKSSSGHSRHSTSGMSISPADISPLSSQMSSGEHKAVDIGVGLASGSQPDGQGSSPSGYSSSRNPLVVVPLVPRIDAEGTSRSEQEGSDSELTCDIWMGPPDWWEEYEARTEGSGRRRGRGEEDEDGVEGAGGGASTTNSEVSSVIEVTTMYLGSSKKDAPPSGSSPLSSPAPTTCSGLTVSMTASSISSSSSATRAGAVSPATPGDQQFLTVDKFTLQRRQSSPSLNGNEASEGEDFLEELASLSESPTRVLHKSSSCQSADLELPRSSEFSGDSRAHSQKATKGYRTAWGRVKDIIHTRKDSVKRRPKKQRSGGTESEETSEVDYEGLYLEEQSRSSSFGEGLLGRSTPKTSSPVVMRQQMMTQQSAHVSQAKPGGGASGVDMAAMLAGSLSDDFNKKMLEWEAKKSRKSTSLKVSGEESDLASLDISSASQEIPLRTVDLRDFKGKVPDSSSDITIGGDSHTSMEVLGAHASSPAHMSSMALTSYVSHTSPAHLEDMQRYMTESFSKKMQEWERLKYRSSQGSQRESSPDMERKGSKSRKDDRQKSKRSREDKEKEKLEKMREREMQKVEREQLKLEKEKLRLEKERLRALEREAKLEKIKGRLSQTEQDSGFKNPVLGPLAEYKVTADFAHKLHQWELKKGLSHDVSNSIYLEAQKLNVQHLREESERQKPVRFSLAGDEASGGQRDDCAGRGYWATSGERSRSDQSPEVRGQPGDDDDADVDDDKIDEADGDDETVTSVTDECLFKSNIDTLERANRQLIENLQQKEMEYADVQQQVAEVNRKLAKVKEEHAKEMARFHRELALGSITEPVKLEVGELESTISTMEEKIKAMENLGERLALSMESAAVGKWQSIDGEETVHNQLVELVDQMRNMLIQASRSEEQSKKSMALSNFEQLYSHAMKLQVQMNNLRLSHLERNREIMTVKRQLLLQEVNNLLLQADITRRETELYQYQAAKKFASLRRWNTFSGSDRARHHAQVEVAAQRRVQFEPEASSQQVNAPQVSIPYIPEEVILASAASSSLSAPASPSAVEAAGGTPHSPSSGGSLLPHHPQLTPTGGSSSGHHLSPSDHQQQQQQQHQQYQLYPTQHQRLFEGPHHSSAVVSPDRGPYYEDSSSNLSTPGVGETHQGLLDPQPSPSLLRAVSDPTQASATQSSSLKSSPQLSSPVHPSTVSRSASDGENISPRQQLPVAPSRDGSDHPTRPQETRAPEASGAIDDLDRCVPGTRDGKTDAPLTAQTSMSPAIPAQTTADAAATSRKIEPASKYDSVPLYHEIMELRKAKSIVERGSPTLILSKEGRGSSSVPSPEKSPSRGESSTSARSGTPTHTIPRQRSLDLAPSTAQGARLGRAATSIDTDYSPEPTVMTCTKNTHVTRPDQSQPGESPVTSRLSPRLERRHELPPSSDSARIVSGKCPRSPVTKHNYLRRQKEDRDTATSSGKHLDYKAISPKGSPLPTRGKPPLPRQNTPVRQSPQASPAVPDKGPRSKSVGEMSQASSAAATSAAEPGPNKPLQDAISKFEKRQTMCETEDRPIELRKTPSPTLHLPRVGLVSRVRRLKPAAELLEESQRFKSGHSIYATRIMHRYLPKDGNKPLPSESSSQTTVVTDCGSAQNNKENSFVHTMVRRLSRETSPIKSAGSSRTNSELSLKRTDSPRSNSEFVSHIVRKLSNGSGSGSPKYKANTALSPFKDRTNDGQVKKIAQAFGDQKDRCSAEKALSDSDLDRREQPQSPPVRRRFQQTAQSPAKVQHRKSCEVAMILSSSSAGTSNLTHAPSETTSQSQGRSKAASPSPTTPPNHQSLPALFSEDAVSRHRAATYCHSQQERRQIEREAQPVRPASTSSAYDPYGHQLTAEVSPGDRAKGLRSGRSAASSLSPVRRGTGRGKMGTVRVLCKQSISFDLGVSLYTQRAEAASGGSPKSTRQVRSWDPSESAKAQAAAASVSDDADVEIRPHSSPGPSRPGAPTEGRPVSSGSEGEAGHASAQTKFRRFLDSSKRFFKVSK
ncbi:hypothetical protein EGW08_001666 [Elysia chlorotica]|uniref:Uncharacterized protein n=1 Tax=Elysia chlorotica TaxID=188477 RepID=A0A433U9U2_ELYCH|nr:hypothetical protein EGW08_001666 [Elysia chlorotica]